MCSADNPWSKRASAPTTHGTDALDREPEGGLPPRQPQPSGSILGPASVPRSIDRSQSNIATSLTVWIEAGTAIAVGIDPRAGIDAEKQAEKPMHHRSLLQPSGSTQEPLSAPAIRNRSQSSISASAVGIHRAARVVAEQDGQKPLQHRRLRLQPMGSRMLRPSGSIPGPWSPPNRRAKRKLSISASVRIDAQTFVAGHELPEKSYEHRHRHLLAERLHCPHGAFELNSRSLETRRRECASVTFG